VYGALPATGEMEGGMFVPLLQFGFEGY
jgi:hypothetical protein